MSSELSTVANGLLIDAALTLTRQRSLTALEREFVSLWERLLPHHLASLLNIERDRNGSLSLNFRHDLGSLEDLKVLLGSDHVAVIESALLQQQVEQINLTEDGGSRMVVLPCNPRECQVVMLLGKRLSEQEETSLKVLTTIYCNCSALLNDNLRDMLTGLLNRRSFEERVSEISAVLRRPKSHEHSLLVGDFATAIMDIDHFKRINDTYGHIVGDETLIMFASIMRSSFRASDLIFRFGGEEFVVLLTHTNYKYAIDALNRFRQNVANHPFPQVGQVTVSIGYTRLVPGALPGQLIGRADQALYFAKCHGRDQVRCYEQLIESGELNRGWELGDVELF